MVSIVKLLSILKKKGYKKDKRNHYPYQYSIISIMLVQDFCCGFFIYFSLVSFFSRGDKFYYLKWNFHITKLELVNYMYLIQFINKIDVCIDKKRVKHLQGMYYFIYYICTILFQNLIFLFCYWKVCFVMFTTFFLIVRNLQKLF